MGFSRIIAPLTFILKSLIKRPTDLEAKQGKDDGYSLSGIDIRAKLVMAKIAKLVKFKVEN